MRELLFAESRIGDANYGYYLIISDIYTGRGPIGEGYGIKIRSDKGENVLVPDITHSYECMVDTLQRLVRGRVTPADLREVLDALLTEMPL